MLKALLWPLLASTPGISYSSHMMEWPSNADDTWGPWILVPSHLEAEQKELEPLQCSGVGRVEEAGPGLSGTMWQ